ncbi:MAG: response regulator [Deltaproteobacteria bacterium]|nr:response regulator [Deltaproteobacteria bacterium]
MHQEGWAPFSAARFRRFSWGLIGLWTALVAASAGWNLSIHRAEIVADARAVAVASYERELAFRTWSAAQGEVYVRATAQTRPSPYLSAVATRDLRTESGEVLTQITPSYMDCQPPGTALEPEALHNRLVSVTPLNPANAPDAWEAAALAAVAAGRPEVFEVGEIDGRRHLRFLRPVVMDRPCLRCHSGRGLAEGRIGGAVSVAVPLEGYWTRARATIATALVGHGALWLAGMAGILLSSRGLIRNVRDREAAWTALQESEEKYRTLADNVDLGIALVGPDHRLRATNAALARWLGRPAEDLAGSLCFEALEHRGDVCPDCPGAAALATRRPAAVDVERERPDGTRAWIRLRAFPLIGADRAAAGYIRVLEDITPLKHAEQERRQLDAKVQHAQKLESLGVLAGGIAHDFNNLLTGMMGNADLALRKLPPDSPARPHLQKIDAASQRAADLTNQMLAYSGKGRFAVEPVNLSSLVEEMVRLLDTVVSKKARLTLHLAPNLPTVSMDATQGRQIVMNLITNASDALGGASGAIRVTTGVTEVDRRYLSGVYVDDDLPEGTYVYLEVGDTGCGMDRETQARVFDPFFSTKATGRGLGLAAVLGIVRGHRGAVKVYSEVGQGTTFKVFFPLAEAHRSDPAAPAAAGEGDAEALWRGSGTVLVVDDDATARSVAAAMLEERGFSVLTAADGQEGVDVFRTHGGEIEAVVLDMTMPRMNGEEVFREMRRLRPDVRVVLTSGYNEQDAINRFTEHGLAGFIQKPYRSDALLRALHAALRTA